MTVLPDFSFHRPSTVAEAVRLRSDLPGSRIIAGGTDLLVNLRRGLGQPSALVDLSGICELSAVAEQSDGGLRIGSGVTLAALAEHAAIRVRFPALAKAALLVAGPTHRTAATLGGNLCQDTRCIYYNQSEWWRHSNGYCLKYLGDHCHVVVKSDRCYATYHGDVAPVLMVLGAQAELVGPHGVRCVSIAELFREVGSDHLTIAPEEFVATITVPSPAGWIADYAKIRVRDAVDFPLAGVAAALKRQDDRIIGLRVAVTGTNSAPLLIPTEDMAGEAWGEAVAKRLLIVVGQKLNVLRTTVAGAGYRRRVLLATTKHIVDELWRKPLPDAPL